ncbi:MAG TPA: hypothetical protein VMT88_07115 [Actinomycetes bacterium]|nr:hypothetical protein [Actinomycetes bacterium]
MGRRESGPEGSRTGRAFRWTAVVWVLPLLVVAWFGLDAARPPAADPLSTTEEALQASPSPAQTTTPPQRARSARALDAESGATSLPADPSIEPVLVLGDSLALGLEDYLPGLMLDRPLTMSAEVGRRSETSRALLASATTPQPPVWIVSLGTNDAASEFGSAVGSIMDLAGPRRCVVWFDVYRPSDEDVINTALTSAATRYPNLHVLPWHALAAEHPEWFGWDGIHPSETGYIARANLAARGVEEFC